MPNKLRLISLLTLGIALAICGCGGGGGSTPPPVISVGLSPSTAQSIDEGQVIKFTASVSNDSKSAGVSWSQTGLGGLSGQSTTAATYTAPTSGPAGPASVTATSVTDPTKNASVSITIALAPAFSTTTLPAGMINAPYSQTVAVTGGTGALTYSISSGTLPPGLSLNTASGAITGTPTGASGTASFTVKVTDSSTAGAVSATQPLTLLINPTGPPSISTTTLPAAVEGTAYTQTVQATGYAPLSFSVSAGTLPAGLTLASGTGVISGTPTGPTGASSFTIKVTDGNVPAQSTTQPLGITVNPAATLTITNTSLANGNINAAYNTTLTSTGGVAPITWSILSGSLPTGLTLTGSTGVISGTPTESGVFDLKFQAADSSNPQQLAQKSLVLTIDGTTLAITTTSLFNPLVGESYNQTLQFTGGTLPVTWSILSGALPAGLSLDSSTGAITGTPTSTSGPTSITFQLADSTAPTSQTKTQAISVTVTSLSSCGSGSESLLSGQYGISLTGFDASGPAGMLASITADGTGKITSGVEDINSTSASGVQLDVPVTTASSSYSIGADHRGCLTLVAGGVTRVFRFAASMITSGVSSGARIVEFGDTTGSNLVGLISVQNASYFSNAAISGNYAFRVKSPLTSAAGGGFFAAVGAWTLSGSTVTGFGDFNSNGVVNGSASLASPITLTPGTYNITAPDGRGTLSFAASSSTVHLVIYVLDNTQLMLMSSDPQSATSNLFSGVAGIQLHTGASTLDGVTVLFGSGLGGTKTSSRVQAGVFTADGVSTFTYTGDQNSGGTPSTQTAAGTYSNTGSNNGRILVTDTGGAGPAIIFYPLDVDFLYGISTDAHVMTLDVEPHLSEPYSDSALTGAYSSASIDPVVAGSPLMEGVANYDGAGNVTGTFERNADGSLSLGNAFSTTYTVSSSGRTVSPASGTTNTVSYVTYIGKVVSFDYTSANSNPTLIVGQP